MPTTDLQPGTVTTLGALRPGDVGVFVHDNGVQTSQFVFLETVERPGWGRVAVAQFEGGGYIDEPWLARPVRYLGRGRVEPARIVMEGEGDRIAELEAQVRTLREAIREAWKNLNPARMVMNDTALDLFDEGETQSGVLTAWEILNEHALAATAPKEKPCTT